MIIGIICDRAVLDPLHGIIDDEARHEEPFAWDYGIAEAILDFDVEPRGIEYAVDQIFELGAVDVVKGVGRDDFSLGHQKGRIEFGVRDAAPHVTARHADLVKHVAVCRDYRMIGLTAQHVDRAAGGVIVIKLPRERRSLLAHKQRPRLGIRDATARLVLMQCPL